MDDNSLKHFLDEHSMIIKSKKEYPNFVLYNLEECPFCNGAHKDGAYIIHNNNGSIVAKCHHNSCKDASWSKLYEIKTGKRYKANTSKSKEKKEKLEKVTDIINHICESEALEVFRDNYGNVIARIKAMDDSIMKVIPVKSYEFKIHFQRLIYDTVNNILDRRDYDLALDYLGVIAYKNSKQVRVYKRIFNDNERIIYELDKDRNISVMITREGISITNEVDVFFHHSKYYANQVEPDFDSIENESYKELLKLIRKHFNLKGDEVVLFAIYLVSSFLGTAINHPIMSISGQKGAGKSGAISRFCQLVDPKSIGLGNVPKSEDDISLRISENYVNAFDNLSFLNKATSDLFCKCVTGGANTRRTLYENNDETTFDLKSIVVLNGIEVIISEADLLDRTIFFHLERLTSDVIKTEAELDKAFMKDKPKILALCFSIVQLALKDQIPVDKSAMMRMADFYEWAIKIGRVLEYDDKDVIKLLQKNQEVVNEQALSENPLAQVLLIYMEYSEQKVSTVTELLKTLKKLAVEQQIDVKLLPKQPNVLSRKLNKIRSNLQSKGITYEIKNKGYSKVITIVNNHPKHVPIKIESV